MNFLNVFDAFHAHIYFDALSQPQAVSLTEQLANIIDVKLGNINSKPIGPHLFGSREIFFRGQQQTAVMSWLTENRSGFSILVHAVSGDDILDHTEYCLWLGDAKELDLTKLSKK